MFYGIGLLKLVSDACGFAGPLLLHELVAYVDQKGEQPWKGYVYTLALCSASFIGEYCKYCVLIRFPNTLSNFKGIILNKVLGKVSRWSI